MSEIVIYKSNDVPTKIDVKLKDNIVQLTQNQIAELFGKDRSTITEHINNIFKDNELGEKSTVGIIDSANYDKPSSQVKKVEVRINESSKETGFNENGFLTIKRKKL